MSRKNFKRQGVLIGATKLVFAELLEDEETGAIYAEDVFRLPGLIEIALTVSISDEALGADNNPLWEYLATLDSVEAALNIAAIGKEAEAYLLGHRIDDNGVLMKGIGDIGPWLAMGFQSDRTDKSNDYIWLNKGRFKPSDATFRTKERGTVNWNTPNLSGIFGPRDFDGEILAKLNDKDADLGAGTLATFFDKPYIPAFTTIIP